MWNACLSTEGKGTLRDTEGEKKRSFKMPERERVG